MLFRSSGTSRVTSALISDESASGFALSVSSAVTLTPAVSASDAHGSVSNKGTSLPPTKAGLSTDLGTQLPL